MTLQQIQPFITAAGFVVLAAAIWWSQWRSGAKQVGAEVIANYERLDRQQKDQIDAYKRDIEEIKASMRQTEKSFIEKIAKLEGAVGEKDRQLEILNKVLANRNPELEKILAEIRDFMRQLALKNDEQTDMLKQATNH